MTTSIHPPTRYDFDKGRREFPLSAFGSDRRRSDVVVSQANQLLRFGRIDEKRTIPLLSGDISRRYKFLAGVKKDRDKHDIGLSVLHAMKAWHQKGWKLQGKNYKITLYGEIDPREREMVRLAVFLFKGVHMGFWLPKAVDGLGRWEYDGENDEHWRAGSLGGTLAYCKSYNEHGYWVLHQGRSVYVSNEFVEHFSDECWICIEAMDYWMSQALDMEKLSVLRPSLQLPI